MSIPHDSTSGYRATRSDLRSTVAMGFVTGMISGLENRDIDIESLLTQSGISVATLADPEARVSLASYANLYNHIVFQLDDEGFGLFAAPLRNGTFEFLCRCALSSRTLGEALARIARFLHILLAELNLNISHDSQIASIEIRDTSSRWTTHDPRRVFAFEWLLRLVHGLACWLVGRSLPLIQVDFPYCEPHHSADYALIYTASPQFAAGERLVATMTANLLELPIRRDDNALEAFLEGAPGKITTLYRRDRLLVRQVRDLLASALPDSIKLDFVACQLHLSNRSLHRRLQEEGSSFRVIKDALRRDLALSKVEKPDASLSEIALSLGYSEFSAFFRAFKTWTGMSPSDYRRKRNSIDGGAGD